MPFGPKGLVVTLSLPVPQDARITYATPDIFAAVNRVMGPEIPADFPKKYSTDLQHVEIFNQHVSFDTEELTRWQKRHNVEMKQEFLTTFDGSFKRGQVVASTLVEHPSVTHPETFADACSVVLQRAVLISNPGPDGLRETIALRSYLHSVDASGKEAANFVPNGGFHVTFPSKTVWFPLELTTGISEPYAWVVLDVLSTKPLNSKQLPSAFRVAKTGKMMYQGKSYRVTRITAKLDTKQKWEDLNIGLE
jgi:hypothetical protein